MKALSLANAPLARAENSAEPRPPERFSIRITRWRDPRYERVGIAWERDFLIDAVDLDSAVRKARAEAAKIPHERRARHGAQEE